MKVDYEKMESCKQNMISKLEDMKTNSEAIMNLTSEAGSSEYWAGKYYDSFQKNQETLLKMMLISIGTLEHILENITVAISNYKQVDATVKNEIAKMNNP